MTAPALAGFEATLVRVLEGGERRINAIIGARGRLNVAALRTAGCVRGQADALLVLISRVSEADAYEVAFHLRRDVESVVQYAKREGLV